MAGFTCDKTLLETYTVPADCICDRCNDIEGVISELDELFAPGRAAGITALGNRIKAFEEKRFFKDVHKHFHNKQRSLDKMENKSR